MGKFKNVNLVSIFAIVLVALGAFGYVTLFSKDNSVIADSLKSWNVHLDSDNYSSYGAGDDGSGPKIGKNYIDFNVNFINPGEYKTYTFEILNTGDINAVLDSVEILNNSTNVDGLSFSYNIYKGDNIITSSIVNKIDQSYNNLYRMAGSNVIEVTITYQPLDTTNLPQIAIAKYKMKLNYVQA